MPDAPRFSVTVPAYNAATTLPQTVASVQAQAFGDWELVIVDDGSTDETRAMAESMAADDPRIRLITQENKGTGGAYNTAVRGSRADLIVMLSADDYLLPEHLARFDAFIAENPEDSIFSSAGYFEYPDDRRELAGLPTVWVEPKECTIDNLLRSSFFAVGAVYRAEVFDRVGGFKEGAYVEDYLFWLQAVALGFTHAYLDAPLGVHRRSAEQKSSDVIRVRESEMSSIQAVAASGLLSAEDEVLARAAIERIEKNIRQRKTLDSVLGAEGAERVIGWIQARRS